MVSLFAQTCTKQETYFNRYFYLDKNVGFLVSRHELEPNRLKHGTDSNTARILNSVIHYILFQMEGTMLHHAVEPNFHSLTLKATLIFRRVSLVSKRAGNGFIMVTCKITSRGDESHITPSSEGGGREGPKS